MNKLEMLQSALTARQEEVDMYQINIENYTMGIELIDEMPDSEKSEHSAFRKQLSDLLVSEKREQNKAKVMLSVLQKQVAALS